MTFPTDLPDVSYFTSDAADSFLSTGFTESFGTCGTFTYVSVLADGSIMPTGTAFTAATITYDITPAD